MSYEIHKISRDQTQVSLIAGFFTSWATWEAIKYFIVLNERESVCMCMHMYMFIYPVPVQSPSRVRLFATPWTAARQASLSIIKSQSSPKSMSIESLMPSNHLILCCPLLLLPSIFPSIRVFSNESALHIRWPKYWSFSFNISPSKEYLGLIPFRMDWLDLLAV